METKVVARSEFSVGDVLRSFGQSYEENHPLCKVYRQALRDLSVCRTAYLGGHKEQCQSCGHERPVYNSCGNVSCPMCQGIKRKKWLSERLSELLPVPYFHSIFTIPHELNDLAYYNQREIYNLLFRSSADTLLYLCKKYHQASPAIISTLHTWGQSLFLHPHVHILITSGGLADDGTWHKGSSDFLFDVYEISAEFKKRFIKGLIRLKKEGLEHSGDFEEIKEKIEAKDWVVNCQKPFAGAGKVVEYLGRYVYRSAIANSRLRSIESSGISFDYKDYKDLDKKGLAKHKEMTLKPEEFIRRFLQHILPKGFRRCRFYGLFAGRKRKVNLAHCKELFAEELAKIEYDEPEAYQVEACPCCGGVKFKYLAEIMPERPLPITFHYRRRKRHA